MTQTLPTRPRTLKSGARVSHRLDSKQTGEVRQSDDFYNSLRLRGVGERQQVLVYWPEAELCTWERLDSLVQEATC